MENIIPNTLVYKTVRVDHLGYNKINEAVNILDELGTWYVQKDSGDYVYIDLDSGSCLESFLNNDIITQEQYDLIRETKSVDLLIVA
jgi:hypothetical protein